MLISSKKSPSQKHVWLITLLIRGYLDREKARPPFRWGQILYYPRIVVHLHLHLIPSNQFSHSEVTFMVSYCPHNQILYKVGFLTISPASLWVIFLLQSLHYRHASLPQSLYHRTFCKGWFLSINYYSRSLGAQLTSTNTSHFSALTQCCSFKLYDNNFLSHKIFSCIRQNLVDFFPHYIPPLSTVII